MLIVPQTSGQLVLLPDLVVIALSARYTQQINADYFSFGFSHIIASLAVTPTGLLVLQNVSFEPQRVR